VSWWDPGGNGLSTTVEFGCWGQIELGSISTVMEFPHLGMPGGKAEHGWFIVNCRIDRDDDGSFDTNGGVHGALWQLAPAGTVLRRNDSGPAQATDASWGRLLVQSITTGDTCKLELENPPFPDGAE
jgi:hypothetical protein